MLRSVLGFGLFTVRFFRLLYVRNPTMTEKRTKIRSTEEAVRGRQYDPCPSIPPEKRSFESVLTDLGRIDGRGRPLKCFLVLLSD